MPKLVPRRIWFLLMASTYFCCRFASLLALGETVLM